MHSQLRIVLATLAFAVGWWTTGRVATSMADMTLFAVRDIEVRGLVYASPEEVIALMDLEAEATVWGDTEEWARRVERHPMVTAARVRRRPPGTLRVEVEERRPVALAATPLLEPVDRLGTRLPVDPAETRLDLPLLSTPRPFPRARLLPEKGRDLAAEVGRLMEADTAFLQRVSEVSWLDERTVRARWSEPAVEFVFGVGTPPHRIREGLIVLLDALRRDPGHPPQVIDLRFADQVVVRANR